jgi:clan AA aspartic protease (TIGR02281 family)
MKTFRRSVLAIACLLVALPAVARRTEVPIEGSGKILIVEASINQRGTGRYIVDTGATYCVISQERARDLSLSGRKDGEKIRVATANGIVEATLAEARRIDVGDAVARDVAVAVGTAAQQAGLAPPSSREDLTAAVERRMWQPQY